MKTILFLSLLLLAACPSKPKPSGAVGGDLDRLHAVPDFTLLERAGKPVGKKDLGGKVWVASFVFTRCPGPCPMMCSKAEGLQKEFADAADFRLVTTTVDPAHDTPAVLTKFAKNYAAHAERWHWLTGDWKSIRTFGEEGLKMNGNWDEPGAHSTYFVLIDRAGVVRGYYDVTEADRYRKLQDDIRTLLGGKAS